MRAKSGKTTHKRHKKFLNMAKGFRGGRSKLYRTAREAAEHSLQYAYRDRRQKKREFRKLWITRINAAARQNGLSYSRMMHGLSRAGVEIDRKALADMAVHEKEAFAQLAETAKAGMN